MSDGQDRGQAVDQPQAKHCHPALPRVTIRLGPHCSDEQTRSGELRVRHTEASL